MPEISLFAKQKSTAAQGKKQQSTYLPTFIHQNPEENKTKAGGNGVFTFSAAPETLRSSRREAIEKAELILNLKRVPYNQQLKNKSGQLKPALVQQVHIDVPILSDSSASRN